MKIDIDIEEDIEILIDQGKRDFIITLRQSTDFIPQFEVNLHMDSEVFNKLRKELNEI